MREIKEFDAFSTHRRHLYLRDIFCGSNRMVGEATRILERNKSLISLAKLSVFVTANPNQYLVCT